MVYYFNLQNYNNSAKIARNSMDLARTNWLNMTKRLRYRGDWDDSDKSDWWDN